MTGNGALIFGGIAGSREEGSRHSQALRIGGHFRARIAHRRFSPMDLVGRWASCSFMAISGWWR
ncbi:hypothetical protein, partial [Streptomyces sp. IBSBF 3136]|uniref:hypothetical protein n=1 Tax=Streptomyces sp. IBSBF 3136 TaxID=2903524 RepID=UPI002FDC6AB7